MRAWLYKIALFALSHIMRSMRHGLSIDRAALLHAILGYINHLDDRADAAADEDCDAEANDLRAQARGVAAMAVALLDPERVGRLVRSPDERQSTAVVRWPGTTGLAPYVHPQAA